MPAARAATFVAAVALVAVAVWLFGLWFFEPWVAHNDFAIFRMRLERVLDGDPGLVGAYSRLDVFHPGPAREWLFAVPYWVSGRRAAAMPATALVLNLAWSAVAAVIVWRRRTEWIGVIAGVSLSMTLLAMRDQLDSPWNPHLAVIPMFVAATATMLVLDGSRRAWMLAVVAASFAAQMHASALIVAGALFAVVVIGERRADDDRRWWRSFVLAAALWIGPAIDLLHGRDANLIRLATSDGGTRLGPSAALADVSRLLWPPSIVSGAAIDPTAAFLTGFGRWWAVLVAVGTAVGVWRCRGQLRSASIVAAVVLVGALVSIAAYFEPPFAYLFAPLQAAAVVALVTALAVAAERTMSVRAVSVSVLPDVVGIAAVSLVVVVGAVAVLATSRDDHESAARRALGLEVAVVEHLAVHPGWEEANVVAYELAAANPGAEIADVLVRNGIEPRSDDPTLDLEPTEPGLPVYLAAMGGSLDCLLGAGAAPIAAGVVPSVDADVAVFAFDVDDLGAARECAPAGADTVL